MSFLERLNDPDVRAFVEAGGYGKFGGWVDGGFTTTDTGGPRRPGGGLYFKDGEYLTIEGTDDRRVPPGYRVIGQDDPTSESGNVGETTSRDPGRLIAKRISPVAAASEAAPAPPPAKIDTEAITKAKDLAEAARSKYATSVAATGLNTNLNPYEMGGKAGKDTQDSLLKYQDTAKAESNLQTTEISEASKQALGRFGGKVSDYQLPGWRDYLNT